MLTDTLRVSWRSVIRYVLILPLPVLQHAQMFHIVSVGVDSAPVTVWLVWGS